MTFFRQFLHAKANFSDRKYVSMSPENSNMHAKIAQNLQIALFNYFCLSELFATLYNRGNKQKSIQLNFNLRWICHLIFSSTNKHEGRCKKFEQTELEKKNSITNSLTSFDIKFIVNTNLFAISFRFTNLNEVK